MTDSIFDGLKLVANDEFGGSIVKTKSETVLERILWLTGNGFNVRISPYGEENTLVEIRLTKDNCTVARIVDMDASHHMYAWKSDEDIFLYYLLVLQFEYDNYINRWKGK